MQPQEPPATPPKSPEQPSAPTDYSQPVAYDNEGRPLYAHPPTATSPSNQPQQVYVSRPMNPAPPDLPEKIIQKHEESKKRFPALNLSHGEYVISAVKRHPIGLLKIWAFVALLIFVFGAVISMFVIGADTSGGSLMSAFGDEESLRSIGMAMMIVVTVLGLTGGFVASYVYNGNRFYLTNESVIQLIQTSLFSMHEQTVSLQNIEDASYEQHGILPQLLNYGRIRLSTEGDETTYRFTYVSNPKRHIAVLNNAVEAFKNGRPVLND